MAAKTSRDRRDAPPDVAGPGTAAVALPALAAVLASAALIEFRPDDLYIYLRVARNVLEGLGWGFNPHEPVNVATSGLWLFLLIGLGGIVGVSAQTAQIASGFFTAAGVAGTASLAGRLAGDRRAAWAAGIALAGDAWIGRWLWSGMETGLAIAIAAWGLSLRASGDERRRTTLAAGLLFALAPLVRPEMLLLPLAAIAASLFEGSRKGRSRALHDALLLAGVGALWTLFATLTWGSPLPSTAVAKGTLGAANIGTIDALLRVGKVIVSTQGPALLLAVFLGTRWLGAAGRHSERAPGRQAATRTIVLFVAGVSLLYAAQHVKVYTRYVLPMTALVVALGFASAVSWSDRLRRARNLLWAGAVLATLAGNMALSAWLVAPKTRAYAKSMRETVIPLALRLGEETREDAVIAVPDIGALGFFSRRKILDLNGLATPEIVPWKRDGRLGEFIREDPPDVLIGIETEPRRWAARLPELPLALREVLQFDGMFVDGPDPMYLTVYDVGVQGESNEADETNGANDEPTADGSIAGDVGAAATASRPDGTDAETAMNAPGEAAGPDGEAGR